jgi:hypothetical protein
MEDAGEKVGRMLNAEASGSRTVDRKDVQGEEETNIKGLTKKYLYREDTKKCKL